MKKAFTMLELIFVIIVIGILSAIILPSTKRSPLQEAAIQLVSHIRYTQHLAMMDDRYDSNDSIWYKKVWQIRFTKGSGGSDDKIAYAIFSDWESTDTHPSLNELAKDPLTGDRIDGGVTNSIHYDDVGIFSKANLGIYYGVKYLDFCSRTYRISFDHLGRPNNTHLKTATDLVDSKDKLLRTPCNISICSVADCNTSSAGEKVTIVIEPETGYIHIL